MHRVFRISEIVAEILEFMMAEHREDQWYDTNNVNRKKDIARLALTCHALLEPALNVLWRHHGSIKTLTACLPEDVRKAWDMDSKEPSFDKKVDLSDLVRPLTSSDWERFQFYAKRIKVFEPDHEDTVAFSDTRFRALCNYRPTQFLLPALLHLTWRVWDPEDLTKMMVFIGPHMKSLKRISSDYSHPNSFDTIASSHLGDLRFLCPFLDEIDFELLESDEMGPGEMWRFVCAAPPVRVISIDAHVSKRALYHLAMMPTLEKLSLFYGDADIPSFDLLPSPLFPKLRTLELHSLAIARVVEIFQGSPKWELRSFSHQLLGRVIPEVAQLVRTLTERCCHQSLDTLVLGGAGIVLRDSINPARDALNLTAPLSVFKNLTTLRMRFRAPLANINNSVIHFIAASFPRLHELDLRIGPVYGESGITLAGLRPLAKHCPHLRRATLWLDPEQPSIAAADDHPGRDWDHGRTSALPELTLTFGKALAATPSGSRGG